MKEFQEVIDELSSRYAEAAYRARQRNEQYVWVNVDFGTAALALSIAYQINDHTCVGDKLKRAADDKFKQLIAQRQN